MGVTVGIVCVVLLLATQARGVPAAEQFSENLSTKNQALPINTIFKLPGAPTAWPPGGKFASGTIDLGGLEVSQVSTFNKVWASYDGGPGNQGFTVYEPTGIPQGFSLLGSYGQYNNKPLFGWVLVAKDVSNSSTNNGTLKQPVDYTLVWNSASLKVTQDTPGYVWLPVAPDGYKALGHVVTTTPDKPSHDRIRCVRSDLTDQCEAYSWIWGTGGDSDPNGFNFYDVRPSNRGTQAPGVHVGTFVALNGGTNTPLSISCLKNLNAISQAMPNLQQIETMLQVYSPFLYFHPDEEYLPSSVNWFFSNGALLYKKGQESNPIPIAPNGTNLPQDANNDGAYWLGLPADGANKERVKKGNLQSSESYVSVKPMLGGTFTDVAMWVFYPFNGPARAKVKLINVINLGKIGEHVGDWEHVTLRVSNLDGQLWQVYFSTHNKGTWFDSSQLEFQSDKSSKFLTKRPVVYSSLHGHASYPHAGLVLHGKHGVGIRDDIAKGGNYMDLGKFVLVSADYLGPAVIEPPWLNYFREWGPKLDYSIDEELKKLDKILPGKLKHAFENVVRGLPKEVLGEEGPISPKAKNNWRGDEI